MDSVVAGIEYYSANDSVDMPANSELFSYIGCSQYWGLAITSGSNARDVLPRAWAQLGDELYTAKYHEVLADTVNETLYGYSAWNNAARQFGDYPFVKTVADAEGWTPVGYEGGTHIYCNADLHQQPDADRMHRATAHQARSHQAGVMNELIFNDWIDNIGQWPCKYLAAYSSGISGHWGSVENYQDLNNSDNSIQAINYGIAYRQDYRPLLVTVVNS